MTKEEFYLEFSKLEECFPKIFKNPLKEQMLAKAVINLEHSWWASTVKRIILKNEPKFDIEQAAKAEMQAKQRISETEAKFAEEQRRHRDSKIQCEKCYETGFMHIADKSIPTPMLILCECEFGERASFNSKMPTWSRGMAQFFQPAPFPFLDFKPKSSAAVMSEGIFSTEILQIAEFWKEKIKISEQFWSSKTAKQ